MNKIKTVVIIAILVCFYTPSNYVLAFTKSPDYANVFLGEDKYENFNRKVFNFNLKLNKYALRPIHIVWASIMPKYGMDRIQGVYTNIQYPRRLVSSLVQKDFKGSKNETIRFLTNTTVGLGGMYDPAKKILKIDSSDECMEEALSKCNMKQGSYLVMPWINGTTPRGIIGSAMDAALNPSNYIGVPVLAFVKLGFTVNNTYYMQPVAKMIESTYADPYDIAKKMYGLERYIKNSNFDRKEILETSIKLAQADIKNKALENIQNVGFETEEFNTKSVVEEPVMNIIKEVVYNKTPSYRNEPLIFDAQERNFPINSFSTINQPNLFFNNELKSLEKNKLKADINLDDYNPQHPVTDAMRTALFEIPEINSSIWSEFSIWNRSFSKRIKTASVNIDPSKKDYKYRYILQKNKTSPLVIIYPSIGEGVTSHHSIALAKLFYDEGYSAIIQGSHFQWEFVESMPDNYHPGLPKKDSEYVRLVSQKIISQLQNKHNYNFSNKIVIGTSFGAVMSLFVAEKEQQENTMNIDRFISINPPVELLYALRKIDKYTQDWQKNPDELKNKVALVASKIIQMSKMKEHKNLKLDILPFNDEEAKLITGFVLHQKLSDLVFTLENASKTKKSDIYNLVNNMSYEDYTRKYLVFDWEKDFEVLSLETSLYSIKDFLKTSDKYKIFHTLDDYLVTQDQLATLRSLAGNKLILVSNGSHLGFLYRSEFLARLKYIINKKQEQIATK